MWIRSLIGYGFYCSLMCDPICDALALTEERMIDELIVRG